MAGRVKSMVGTVVSDKMQKTVVVLVERMARHPIYKKTVRRSKRYLAHDDRFGAKVGDLVRIVETRPLSRRKRWRVVEVLQRGEVAEVAPSEIDREYLGGPEEAEEAAEQVEAPAAQGEEVPAGAPVAEAEDVSAATAAAAVSEERPSAAPVEEPPTIEEEPRQEAASAEEGETERDAGEEERNES